MSKLASTLMPGPNVSQHYIAQSITLHHHPVNTVVIIGISLLTQVTLRKDYKIKTKLEKKKKNCVLF